MHVLLLVAVFVVATCGLIYELVAGTLASYLLGDSVTQFSTIIGVYLFSMGIGSYLSKFFDKHLISWFIQIEILVGFVGGISSSVLFLLFEHVESFRIILYFFVMLTGILVGLEIPLLMRILKNKYEFKELVSKIFTVDYIGALLASLIFPLILVPYLGLIKTSFLFGVFNVLVAIFVCRKFKEEIKWYAYLNSFGILVTVILLSGFVLADKIQNYSEAALFNEKIVYSTSSPYQRIVLTRNRSDIKLYLNGNLQFNSKDEYRYHEALVHPAMWMSRKQQNVLVLGGGDGLAVRELLKYNQVKKITLIDLDKKVTDLFTRHPMLTALNKNSLSSEKLHIINTDAFIWLKENKQLFDVVLIDFPDPGNYSVGKLYTTAFYKLLYNALTDSGLAVIQSTSPFVAPKSYNCVNTTLNHVGFLTIPYHTYVPSFGDWGYIMALKKGLQPVEQAFPKDLKFIDQLTWQQMKQFPKDMHFPVVDINRLNNQALVHYFEEEWANVVQ